VFQQQAQSVHQQSTWRYQALLLTLTFHIMPSTVLPQGIESMAPKFSTVFPAALQQTWTSSLSNKPPLPFRTSFNAHAPTKVSPWRFCLASGVKRGLEELTAAVVSTTFLTFSAWTYPHFVGSMVAKYAPLEPSVITTFLTPLTINSSAMFFQSNPVVENLC